MDHLSEHCKEVYAHFGLAMYRAQCVEQSIIQLLVFFDFFPTNLPKYKTTEQWAKDFDKYDELLSSKTMGQLLKNLNTLSAVDPTIEELLKKALNQRNWLAHSFFVDHALSFLSSNGRDKMIQELEESRELFNTVENILNPITHSLCEKYGLTQEKRQEMERELFRDAYGDLEQP